MIHKILDVLIFHEYVHCYHIIELQSANVGDGNHSNREGNNHDNCRFHPNNVGFFDNHECGQSLKQVWRQDDFRYSNEKGDGDCGIFFGGIRGGTN